INGGFSGSSIAFRPTRAPARKAPVSVSRSSTTSCGRSADSCGWRANRAAAAPLGCTSLYSRTPKTKRGVVTKRLLVIEDEPQMLLGLRDNLELEGYEVVTAADGEDGLA